jgi:hypothetical protein
MGCRLQDVILPVIPGYLNVMSVAPVMAVIPNHACPACHTYHAYPDGTTRRSRLQESEANALPGVAD